MRLLSQSLGLLNVFRLKPIQVDIETGSGVEQVYHD